MTSKPTHGKAMLMHLFHDLRTMGGELIPAPSPIHARSLRFRACYACPNSMQKKKQSLLCQSLSEDL